MAKYRIHFTDNYGPASIEVTSDKQYDMVMNNLEADPMTENIWTEYYDEEEGWQA